MVNDDKTSIKVSRDEVFSRFTLYSRLVDTLDSAAKIVRELDDGRLGQQDLERMREYAKTAAKDCARIYKEMVQSGMNYR